MERIFRQENLQRSKATSLLKRAMLKQLAELRYGNLTLIDGDENYQFHGNEVSELSADIEVVHDEFYWFVALGGSVGAGEAFINGFWKSTDLTKVIQLFAVNQSVMDSMESGLARLTSPIKKMFHWLNKNTRKGSRKNIVAHYDLGNEFFEAFLDSTMMYSSGIFFDERESMKQASLNKLERICQRLRLNENDHLLEIGTGWGSFAIYAAKKFGCKVTTTTISDEQYAYAKKRIEILGLTDKVFLLKEDYRLLEGKETYDKLVSIEMIEAVGHQYFDTFFSKCSELLKPNGEMLLQAITISDQRFSSAKKEIDFIKRYIFPGSCIPSVDAISDSLRKSTDMRVLNLEDLGIHYALTLKKWRENFIDKGAEIKSQGFSDAFMRMWEFYLCYCEGGFRERVISNVQLHLVKPMARVPMTLSPYSNKPGDNEDKLNISQTYHEEI
ncbi:class I SAM-dependent methyltransferase [Aliikangiella coralliicola]|uniref:Class I SAM-dependent methyltransferase n=2 Tax=Aliikangiella coralliicola TaxID=2592383 RepID=A0A545U6K2_9GAMM|nr:class I SAM-dependent methyltransferase [Aliikangiella coralliicola]